MKYHHKSTDLCIGFTLKSNHPPSPVVFVDKCMIEACTVYYQCFMYFRLGLSTKAYNIESFICGDPAQYLASVVPVFQNIFFLGGGGGGYWI